MTYHTVYVVKVLFVLIHTNSQIQRTRWFYAVIRLSITSASFEQVWSASIIHLYARVRLLVIYHIWSSAAVLVDGRSSYRFHDAALTQEIQTIK